MNRGYQFLGFGITVTGCIACAIACASDNKSSTAEDNNPPQVMEDGGIYSKLGVPVPAASADGGLTPQPFLFETVKSPYDDAAGCKSFTSDTIKAGDHADERSCLCDNCFMLHQQCDALQGCQEIMQCILDIGCTDSNSCYLGPQKTSLDPDGKGCVDVI